MSRLEEWLDEEIALMGPLGEHEEEQYRAALGGTFRAAFLRLEDAADELRQPMRWLAHRRLRRSKAKFDQTTEWALREWFRRHW